MKICTKCSMSLDIDKFDKAGITTNGVQKYRSECRLCKSKRDSLDFQKNKEKRKIQLAAATAARLQRTKQFIFDYLKTHPCVDCGETNIIVLEFDHCRGLKIMNVSKMVMRHYSLDKILTEIEKCEVRCANCHRIVTAKRGNWMILEYV